MKNFCFFVLAYADWEDYEPYFFIGPAEYSQEDFQKICEKLVPDTVLSLLAYNSSEPYPDYIGWNSIVKSMILLLDKEGFTHIEPKKVVFVGGQIIDEKAECKHIGLLADNVIHYNESIRYNYYRYSSAEE